MSAVLKGWSDFISVVTVQGHGGQMSLVMLKGGHMSL